MSLYLEQIKQLAALQRVDDDIHHVKAEIDNAPIEREKLRASFDSVDNQRSYILEKISHLIEQEKRIGAEIDEEVGRLRKSKNKLMQVTNTREYQAMAREMDNLEKRNRTREEERTALIEEHKVQDSALEEISISWTKLDEEFKTYEASLDLRIKAAEEKLIELTTYRSGVGKNIPKPVLDRYEFIRRRLAHPVIVPVTNGICAGCCIAIPPQAFIELQSGHKILNCPNCQRLIYWSEHFSEKEVQAKEAE